MSYGGSQIFFQSDLTPPLKQHFWAFMSDPKRLLRVLLGSVRSRMCQVLSRLGPTYARPGLQGCFCRQLMTAQSTVMTPIACFSQNGSASRTKIPRPQQSRADARSASPGHQHNCLCAGSGRPGLDSSDLFLYLRK